MTELKGKKVLMFSPYGATKHYGEAIKEELETRGGVVYGYDERPSQNSLVKIVIRLNPISCSFKSILILYF